VEQVKVKWLEEKKLAATRRAEERQERLRELWQRFEDYPTFWVEKWNEERVGVLVYSL
jgi:hypothetical protein